MKHSVDLTEKTQKRVDLSSFGINESPVEVNCKFYTSGIGRTYVVVTVSQKTEFFLSGVLDALGMSDRSKSFSATAYAECVDMIGHTSTVNLAQYATGSLSAYQPLGEAYNSFGDLWKSVKKFLGIK